ncbi:hypothetical protein GCM10027176_25680 [Actinoallomurus bryophytorum]|uniref:WD40 repeat protein n=1 Tax=Actinoallomurus bryophytorum TaxID=1490222 RepID=A0A543CPH7_9ACTN|nr:hypothetical protein [Actinoallomurus bryophytorum]TQL99005.1 hypothetical protein FB559_4658 [Actinoallomurus bryophytorum]
MLARTTIAAGLATGALALGTGLVPAVASPPARTAPQAVRAAVADPPVLTATLARSYDTFDANQAVAVDKRYFYVVDNRSITKHDRATGRPLLQFVSPDDGPIIHMDSAAVVDGKLYTAHSNYDDSPMESSIEVYDTKTMRHIRTYGFGIYRGSLTWIDRHDGAWWAGFANYDVVPDGQTQPYGQTYNTQIVKMDDDFQVVGSWTIPKKILDRFKPMSNSGGSWGPDGRLWLTGHDLGEAYVMNVPAAGPDLEWAATVTLPNVEGQGIAWDRSGDRPTLWAIKRSTKQALSFDVPYRSIEDPAKPDWQVLGPGHFQQ